MKVAFVDIDGTLIKGQTQIHFLLFLFRKREVSLLDLARVFLWYFGYKVFGRKINEKLVKKIYGKIIGERTVKEIDCIMDNYFRRIEKLIYPKGSGLLAELKKEDYKIIILSSTLQPIAEKFGNYFRAEEVFCTKLEVVNDTYTGKISGEIVQGSVKVRLAEEFIKLNNPEEVAVLSDHITDLPVFKIATRPIAVNPDKKLLGFAKKENWEIIKL